MYWISKYWRIKLYHNWWVNSVKTLFSKYVYSFSLCSKKILKVLMQRNDHFILIYNVPSNSKLEVAFHIFVLIINKYILKLFTYIFIFIIILTGKAGPVITVWQSLPINLFVRNFTTRSWENLKSISKRIYLLVYDDGPFQLLFININGISITIFTFFFVLYKCHFSFNWFGILRYLLFIHWSSTYICLIMCVDLCLIMVLQLS